MALTRRSISRVKLDSSLPQGVLCTRCHTQVEVSTCKYGRTCTSWFTVSKLDLKHLIHEGALIIIPTIQEKRIPKMVKGYFCDDCYEELWAKVWRDKSGHLRHAIDILHSRPGEVVQPKGDEFEYTPLIKGLYAPHVGRAGSKSGKGSPVIHESREALLKTDRLKGFKRGFRRKSAVKVLMKKGKPKNGFKG